MPSTTFADSAAPNDHPVRQLIVEISFASAQAMLSVAGDNGFAAVSGDALDFSALGITMDPSYPPVVLPGVTGQDPMQGGFDSRTRFSIAATPEASTVICRALGDEAAAATLAAHPQVVGVYADVAIEPMIICPGSPALGDFNAVAQLLCTANMRAKGMTGAGVMLAIVDTGINRAHLAARGLTPTMDTVRSWVPVATMVPFEAPVGHGTMCAFDALIAAPQATLLDIQLLRSQAGGGFGGMLSDAVRAYAHLATLMGGVQRPGESRSLVVNNSWGMFHPSWDFPVGNPGNYSDNPNHPFNRAVATLEAAGADIVFAAGNCGANCPDGRCQNVVTNTIYGANGHPSVLTVAGVDTTKLRVGYSGQGPGRLSRNKPDVAGYTHFLGSGVYPADGGTSAASPVVAGVVAAVRSARPYQPGNVAASPHAIRELLRSTAQDLGTTGFDFDTGYGVVDGCALTLRLFPAVPPVRDLCQRFPELCRPRPILQDFCRRFPQLCSRIPIPEPRPLPGPFPGPRPGPFPGPQPGPFPGPRPSPFDVEAGTEPPIEQLLAAMWEQGYNDGLATAPAAPAGGKCNCS